MKLLKNNLYVLNICFKVLPLYLSFKILLDILCCAYRTTIALYFMRYIVESVQENQDFRKTMVLISVMLILNIILEVLNNYLQKIIEPQAYIKLNEALTSMIYQKAVSVDLSCYETPSFYDSYTKANEQILYYALSVIRNLSDMIGVIVSLIISIRAIISSESKIIIIVLIPMIIEQILAKKYSAYKFMRNRDTVYERRQLEYTNRVTYLQEFAKDIRLTNIFTPILISFENAVKNMIETSKIYGKKIGVVRFFRTIISEIIVYLGVQSFIVYQYIINSKYTLGELITLLSATSEFSNVVNIFSSVCSNIYQNGLFVENFRVFMEYETKISENENGKSVDVNSTKISIKNVSFTYEGSEIPVLKNINMTIDRGQRIAIVGHNGAGKSTFVKLIMRLYDVTTGSIEVGGIDIREYKLKEYRGLFGTIFQDFKIFAASIIDNILLRGNVTESDENKVKAALESCGLYGKIEALPNKMNSQLTKEFASDGVLLSGGEQQKLAIARVFVKESEIYIFDEPSSALDPISEYEIFENMLKACGDKTVIFISHRLSSTVMADKIYLLENGEIVESGNHEELMKQNGKYAEMYEMQAKKYKEELRYED